jgi:tetratricopeptide (TPR) repeat protein
MIQGWLSNLFGGSKENGLLRRLKENPENLALLKELAEYYESKKKTEKAAKILARIAVIRHSRGFLAEAIAYIKKATKLSPKEWSYFDTVGTYLQEKGFDFEALPYLKRALELLEAASERRRMPEILWKMIFLTNQPGMAAYQLVSLCLDLKDSTKAKHYADKFLSQALLKNKPVWIVDFFRGLGTEFPLDATLKERSFEAIAASDDEACQAYLKEVQGRPELEGVSFGKPIRFEQILEQFKHRATLRLEEDQDATYHFAVAYHDMGLYEEALEILRSLEGNLKLNFEVQHLKAVIYKAKGETTKAKEVLAAIAALSNLTILQFIGVHYELALVYEELTETEMAVVELEKVVILDPNFSDAQERLFKLRHSTMEP